MSKTTTVINISNNKLDVIENDDNAASLSNVYSISDLKVNNLLVTGNTTTIGQTNILAEAQHFASRESGSYTTFNLIQILLDNDAGTTFFNQGGGGTFTFVFRKDSNTSPYFMSGSYYYEYNVDGQGNVSIGNVDVAVQHVVNKDNLGVTLNNTGSDYTITFTDQGFARIRYYNNQGYSG